MRRRIRARNTERMLDAAEKLANRLTATVYGRQLGMEELKELIDIETDKELPDIYLNDMTEMVKRRII